MANLRRGSRGDEVKDLQTLLNDIGGYNLAVDGSFGPATERAVRDYQTKNNLTVDGIAGVNTMGALRGASSKQSNAATGEVADNAATQAPEPTPQQQAINTINTLNYTPVAPTQLNNEYLAQYETGRPEYSEDPAVAEALARFREHEANRPGEYQGTYDQQIQQILDNINSRGPFQYDFNADPIYQQYRQQYINQGQRAMQDTMANAAALTGGYGNSYAQTAGQQAYNNYIGELNNVIPDLYDAAYNRYQNDLNNNMNLLGVYQNLDQAAYGKYRDTVNDYYNDLDRYYRQYGDMSDRDYQRYLNDADAWDRDRAYWYGRAQDELGQNNWMNQFAYQQAQDRQDQENWEKEYALKLASLSGGGGSGGGGGGGGGQSYDTWFKNMLSRAEYAYKNGGITNLTNQLDKMRAEGNITGTEYSRLLNEARQNTSPSKNSATAATTSGAYIDYKGAAGNNLANAAVSWAAEQNKKNKKKGTGGGGKITQTTK